MNSCRWLYAQTDDLVFERLSQEQGLSDPTVFSIFQDSHGFMWFGTVDGLNRFDGYSFVIYRHSPADSNSISDNFIRSIYEDHSHTLWIGTGNGLEQFNPHTEKFIHHEIDPISKRPSDNEVRAIHEDRADNLWVGAASGGLNRFDRKTGVFKRYLHDPQNPNSLSHNSVSAIYEDRPGRLWIGTVGGGLNRFNPTTGEFIHFKNDPQDSNSLNSNIVLSLYGDSAGETLWVGTHGGGLNKLRLSEVGDTRPGRGTFSHFLHDPADSYSLSDNRVFSICGDSTGVLWLGTFVGGLNKFDPEKKIFTCFQHDLLQPKSLSGSFVLALSIDRSGNLWCGTNGRGLNKLNLNPAKFLRYRHDPNNPGSLQNMVVRAIHQGPDGALWVGTSMGLEKLEAGGRAFQHVSLELQASKSNMAFVFAIESDNSGILWVGTFGHGLIKYHTTKGIVKQFKHDPKNMASLSNNMVTCLWMSRDGTLWVGTLGGLNAFDRATETFKIFKHDPQNPNRLSLDAISCLREDQSGNLWIGTDGGGLNRFDPESQKFVRYIHDPSSPNSLSHNSVRAIYEDPQGVLWVGTNSGLNQFDRQTGQFTHYEVEGLRSVYICGILEDDRGNLWLSTNKGVARFNPQLPKSKQLRMYDTKDGLQALSFLEGSAYQSHSGEMFFGGNEGLNRFHPQNVLDNPLPPPVVVTSFEIFDKPVTMDTAISTIKAITLSYKEDFFSFEFAALDYTHPGKNQYAYKMEGFDEDWIQSGTRRYASYTNLDHGDYRFRVKGSNNDGVWNEQGASIRIIITPPFWESWWFRFIIAIAFIGVLAAIYRYRVSHLLAVERLRVRIASDLHDDIGATLTKISLQSELIQEGACAPEISASLRKIGAMSRELVTTMSDVVWSIDARNDTVGDLIDHMRDFASSVFSVKPINVSFEVSGLNEHKRLPVPLRQNIYLIFKEAINNIAKHAMASHVEILVKNFEGKFSLMIRDDGKGWDDDEYEKLTGHGVRNMKMRAERIGGRLEISRNGGCTVRLTAPALR